MLGHRLVMELREHGETFGTLRRCYADYVSAGVFQESTTFSGFNATDDAQLDGVLRSSRPDVVFNAIAVLRPERAEKECIEVNSILPRRLADRCKAGGIRVLHVSTDGVFSGRAGYYNETAVPDAEDLYGRSKLLGEVLVPHVLNLRTCVVGRELGTRRSLVEWFLSRRGTTVRGYSKAVMNGFTAPALAGLMSRIALQAPNLHGIWHLGGEPISKFRLLELVNDAYECRASLEPDDSVVCDRSLDARGLLRQIPLALPDWNKMIQALARDSTRYDN
jgi:dTDP-4-dehydrorhamnose reductase